MDKDEALRQLSETNESLIDLEQQRHEIAIKREPLYDEKAIIRAKIDIEIGTAKDENGKLLYPNEKLREAMRVLKLSEHERYQEIDKRTDELHHEGESFTIEFSRLQMRRQLLMLELGLSDQDNRSH